MRIKLSKKYTITSIPKTEPRDTDNPLVRDLWHGGYSFAYRKFLWFEYLLWSNLRVR